MNELWIFMFYIVFSLTILPIHVCCIEKIYSLNLGINDIVLFICNSFHSMEIEADKWSLSKPFGKNFLKSSSPFFLSLRDVDSDIHTFIISMPICMRWKSGEPQKMGCDYMNTSIHGAHLFACQPWERVGIEGYSQF